MNVTEFNLFLVQLVKYRDPKYQMCCEHLFFGAGLFFLLQSFEGQESQLNSEVTLHDGKGLFG